MAAAIREGRFEIDEFIAQMDAGGAGILETAKATETWQEKLKILRNKVLVKLEPVLVGLVTQVGKLADWISDKLLPAMGAWWKDHGPEIVAFFKEVGRKVQDFKRAVLPVFERALEAIRPLGDWFVHNKQAITAAAVAIGAVLVVMFTAWAVSAGAAAVATIAAAAPVLALLLAVGLLAAGIYLLIKNWDAIKAKVEEVIDSIVSKVENIPVIGQIFTATVRVVEDKIKAMISFMGNLIAFGKELINFFKAVFAGDWAEAWDSLKEMAKIALQLFLDFLQLTFVGTIRSVLSALNVWDLVKGAFTGAKDGMVGAFRDAKDGILTALGNLWTGIAGKMSGIAGAVKFGMNTMISLFERGINAIIGAWNALEFGMDAVKVAGKTVIPGFNVGTPNIPLVNLPRLEKGGRVLKTGLAEVHEGERFSRGGGDTFIFQHYGTLMGNEAEAERFAGMMDARLRRKWRRQYA